MLQCVKNCVGSGACVGIGFNLLKQLVLVVMVGVTALSTSGCSPSTFFGRDDKVQSASQNNYRQGSPACNGMNLSRSTLDSATFVQLVDCLNNNGAISPLARLVHRLENEEPRRLSALVDFLNRYLLTNQTRLYEFESTLSALARRGQLDEVYRQVGILLENRELVSSSVGLLRHGFMDSSLRTGVLQSLEQIGPRLTPEHVVGGLEVLIQFAEAPAFSEIQKRLRPASVNGRGLKSMIDGLHAFLTDRDPQHVAWLREFLVQVGNGNSSGITDELLGANEVEIREKVPRFSTIFPAVFFRGQNLDGALVDGARMGDICSLYHYLHRPLRCFRGAASIGDMDLNLLNELARPEWTDSSAFYRNNLLLLSAMNRACEYPPELGKYYSSMLRLSETTVVDRTTEVVRSFHARGLDHLLVNILADTGSPIVGAPAENTVGVRRLFPLLTELTERGVWEDFLFWTTSLGDRESKTFRDFARFLTQTRLSNGESLYDAFTRPIERTNSEQYYRFIASFERYVRQDQPVLLPFLRTLRSAFYVNDVHPTIDLFREFLSSATQNAEILETLFSVAEMQEFQEVLGLFSDMAKDGRLKELVGSLAALFHRFALEGKGREIVLTPEPVYVSPLRHHWTYGSAGVALQKDRVVPRAQQRVCDRININASFDRLSRAQMDDYLACLSSTGSHQGLIEGINYLRSMRTEDGRDFLQWQFDVVNSLKLDDRDVDDLVHRWFRSAQDPDGLFFRSFKMFSYWVAPRRASRGIDLGIASPLNPLFRCIERAMSETASQVRRVLSAFARTVRSDSFGPALRTVDRMLAREAVPPPPVIAPIDGVVEATVRQWVRLNEEGDADQRTAEIIDDYRNAVTNHDLVFNRPRRGWDSNELKERVRPLFEALADPRQSSKDLPLKQAALEIIRGFGEEVSDPTTPNLAEWLSVRSNDPRPILYYYPGEACPRVRLVNSLDRLELLLINSDFQFVLKRKFGFDFLAQIAHAWGDEPRDRWPRVIRQKYPYGAQAPTLSETVAEIEQMVERAGKVIGGPPEKNCQERVDPNSGFPFPFWLKARVFNLAQVSSVIGENLPGSRSPQAGGLRVLRNILTSLYYSSPEDGRDAAAGPRNNFTQLTRLAEVGFLRQIGRILMRLPPVPSDPGRLGPAAASEYQALLDGARFVAGASRLPAAHQILDSLFPGKGDYELAWRAFESVLALLDETGGEQKAAWLKQLVFYAVADVSRLRLTEHVANAVVPLFVDGQSHWLAHFDQLEDFIRDREVASAVRVLYEFGPGDPGREALRSVLAGLLGDDEFVRDAFTILRAIDRRPGGGQRSPLAEFLSRTEVLTASVGYRALRPRDLTESVLRLLEDKTTGRSVRVNLADRLEPRLFGTRPGDVEELLSLIARSVHECDQKAGCKTDRFYRFLVSAAHYIDNNSLQDWLEYGRRSMTFVP